jgi:two-component system, NarL family, invasion response regulator UvrY
MQQGSLEVFVVESNDVTKQLAVHTIHPYCKNVQTFESNRACLEMLQEKMPHAILMEYKLDEGFAGLETLKKIKERSPDVKVIVFSESKEEVLVKACFNAGAFDFVYKDTRFQKHLNSIFNYLNHSITKKERKGSSVLAFLTFNW